MQKPKPVHPCGSGPYQPSHQLGHLIPALEGVGPLPQFKRIDPLQRFSPFTSCNNRRRDEPDSSAKRRSTPRRNKTARQAATLDELLQSGPLPALSNDESVTQRISSVGYGSSTKTPFAYFISSGLNMPVRMLTRNRLQSGRGRDGSYLPPPAQIRTCGTTAYGSCLGYVTRSDPRDKDVHFWA